MATINPVDISSFTPEQKAAFNRANALGTGVQTTDTSVIPVTGLQTTPTPIVVPPVTQPPSTLGTIDSLLTSFQQPTQEEGVASDIQKQLLEVTKSLGGQSARQAELEAQQGLPEQRKQLQDIVNQLQGLQKEAAAIPLQIQQEFAGRGVTAGGVAPIETARLRENSIKALGLSAIGQTLQGNIGLAQQNIAKAIELEFQPQETALKTLSLLYEFNKDALVRADKKRAESLQIILDERKRLLDEEKEARTAIQNLVIKTASNFGNPAPQSVIEQAQNTKDVGKALSLLSPYLANPLEAQAQVADIQNKQASTALSIANRRKVEAEISSTTGQTPAAKTEILKNYTLVDTLFNSPAIGAITGIRGLVPPIPGTPGALAENQFLQIKGLLSLENRQKLKGQGSVSDFEGKILAQASTVLNKNLSEDDFKYQTAQIRGAFANAAGLEAPVIITAPDGTQKIGAAGRETINQAIESGYKVEYLAQ